MSRRVDELVASLTLSEKTQQLVRQTKAVPRLGLPSYNWRNNVLHGVVDNGVSTMFPQAIGLAASWDAELLLASSRVWAEEQRAKFNERVATDGSSGMNYGLDLWGPNINMAVHALWGRNAETYGEDPLLTGVLAAEVVHGLQQEAGEGFLKTVATPKHFAAYVTDKQPERLKLMENVSETHLRQFYLPAWRHVVQAGAASVMCSYNGIAAEYGGLSVRSPMCMSPLLQRVLREDMGFKGYIVTDSGALDFMVDKRQFNLFATKAEAAAAAIKAGVDVNSGSIFGKPLEQAVAQGLVSEELVDRALRRALSARARMGTLDARTATEANPFANISTAVVNSEAHRAVALRAAQEGIVLLKNRAALLPLARGTKVAVVGPAADDVWRMVGNYFGCTGAAEMVLLPECQVQSALAALREEPGLEVRYSLGASQEGNSTAGFADAVAAAQDSDVVVVAVGLQTCRHRVPGGPPMTACEGEGKDRSTLLLPGKQHDLVKAMHATGKPVVLVVSTGAPVSLYWEAEHVDAILVNWYGGAMGGRALAQALTGALSPAGRLPVTFPTNDTQLTKDILGTDLETPPGRTYRYLSQPPLFGFGFGLSYTSFAYSDAAVVAPPPRRVPTSVSVTVRNTGEVASDEVVMVYASYRGALAASAPRKMLVGFQRVAALRPGASRRVTVAVAESALCLVHADSGKFHVLPGRYTLFAGGRAPESAGQFVSADAVQEPLQVAIEIVDDEEMSEKSEKSEIGDGGDDSDRGPPPADVLVASSS